jgi:hypothetical protein
MIPSYLIQGRLIPRAAQVSSIASGAISFKGILTYFQMMPYILQLIGLVIAVLSAVLVIRVLLYLDLIIKGKSSPILKKDLFIILGVFVILGFYTWVAMHGGSYDAFILPLFPSLFVLMSSFLFEARDFIVKKMNADSYKKIITLIIIVIVLFSGYQNYKFANDRIMDKESSYYNLKLAGLWLKDNTSPTDIIAGEALTELSYYTERKTMPFEGNYVYNNTDQFLAAVKEKKPKYIVWTAYEDRPAWAKELLSSDKLNLTVAQAWFIDRAQQYPDAVVFEVNY